MILYLEIKNPFLNRTWIKVCREIKKYFQLGKNENIIYHDLYFVANKHLFNKNILWKKHGWKMQSCYLQITNELVHID